MLVSNVDTYEFGVLYNKNKVSPIKFLEELNEILNYTFEIKVYYSGGICNKEFFSLASKARIKVMIDLHSLLFYILSI